MRGGYTSPYPVLILDGDALALHRDELGLEDGCYPKVDHGADGGG
jgi:hypothetical protein